MSFLPCKFTEKISVFASAERENVALRRELTSAGDFPDGKQCPGCGISAKGSATGLGCGRLKIAFAKPVFALTFLC